MSTKLLKDWTVPILDGVSVRFPCLMGSVMSNRRISNPQERCRDNECGQQMSVDIITSEIVSVETPGDILGFDVIHVTTKGGTVYQLDGEPRPSFYSHISGFCIEKGPTALKQLVSALKAVCAIG